MEDKAQEIFEELRGEGFEVAFDTSGKIGKRYARADEIGTPYCVTIDYDSLKDDTVTIRDRDTMKQIRVHLDDLNDVLILLLSSEYAFDEVEDILAEQQK